MYLNTGSWGRNIFVIKLTFEMLSVYRQQHSFLTYERMFLWKCRRFSQGQKMSRPEGESKPQSSDSCRMLWPLELSGTDIFCPMYFNTGSGGIDIFVVKLTFETLKCVRAALFNFYAGTDVLVKVMTFYKRKMSRIEGNPPPPSPMFLIS